MAIYSGNQKIKINLDSQSYIVNALSVEDYQNPNMGLTKLGFLKVINPNITAILNTGELGYMILGNERYGANEL